MAKSSSIFDKTLSNLLNAWNSIRLSGRGGKALKLSPYLHDDEREELRTRMHECLERKGGEVSVRARAASLGEAYLKLNDEGRKKFLEILASEFTIDQKAVMKTVRSLKSEDLTEHLQCQIVLRELLTPPHMTLLTQFNALPQGIKFLVDLRADLLRYKHDNPHLKYMDESLRRQLSSWFDIGFLTLREITWDAPASLLEKLIHYEAVHRIQSWDELKKRLDTDRRCYAFFHLRMPDEPLIFVWVALVPEMSDNVQFLLDTEAPPQNIEKINTAIFYSISNTQQGLQGVSLGNFLIKRVVDYLLHELPHLKRFATLSPIPGFRQYLTKRLATEGDEIFNEKERKELDQLRGNKQIVQLFATDDWLENEELSASLRNPMMRLCAHYLVREKCNQSARNPVTHFHLSNGARVERINWLGDKSENGRANSFGLMVNYLYKMSNIDRNHELYSESGEVATSKAVRALLE